MTQNERDNRSNGNACSDKRPQSSAKSERLQHSGIAFSISQVPVTTNPVTRLITRESLMFGTLAAIAVAAVTISVIAAQGYGAVLRSDGQHFYRVALDPFGDGRIFTGSAPDTGTAYRYGRILFPLAAWLLAFGRRAAVVFSLPAVYVGSIFLFATLATARCQRAGRPAISGLAALLVPASFITVPLMVPEILIAGLVLLIYGLEETGRRNAARFVASLLLLTRETAVLALAPLGLRAVRDWRAAVGWGASVVPLIVWYGWLRVRMGVWPFLDPGVNPMERALSAPVMAFLAMAWHEGADWPVIAAALMGWITLVAAAAVAWKRPSPLSSAALWMAALVLVFGPAQVELPGEAVRLMLPAQLITAVAALALPNRPAPDSRNVPESPDRVPDSYL